MEVVAGADKVRGEGGVAVADDGVSAHGDVGAAVLSLPTHRHTTLITSRTLMSTCPRTQPQLLLQQPKEAGLKR